jgi:hypothetical protein
MGWALGAIVIGLVVAVAVAAVAASESAVESEGARHTQLLEVSKFLAGGLALAGSVLALVASRSGGVGRVLANAETRFLVGVALIVVSVVFALAGMTVVASAPSKRLVGSWLVLTVLAIVSFVGSIFTFTAAVEQAAGRFETPSVGATLSDGSVAFDVSLPLLDATDTLTVTVHAYPPGIESIPIPADGEGESRGAELYRGTTGPGADGAAVVQGAVPVPEGDYEQIEVRAYRNGRDGGCLDYDARSGEARTGCVQVWLVPRPPD